MQSVQIAAFGGKMWQDVSDGRLQSRENVHADVAVGEDIPLGEDVPLGAESAEVAASAATGCSEWTAQSGSGRRQPEVPQSP